MAHPRPLGWAECSHLLRSGVAGRLAVSAPDGPHIVPVNYTVVDSAIIVRTSPFSVIATHGRDGLVAFEVDHVDADRATGWSVVARGRAEVVRDRDELDHIRAVGEPRPWVTGGRDLVLRIRWTELTGRRLGSEPEVVPGADRSLA